MFSVFDLASSFEFEINMKRAKQLAERLKESQKAKAALGAIGYLEAFTKPAVSDVLKLDMNLVGMPGDVSELRTGADKELFNANHGVDVRRLDIRRPIFDETDDCAVRKALGVDASCHWTFQGWHAQCHDIRRRYAINVFCHGSYILREDVPLFIQEVEAFNADLQDLRRRVCAVLESRGHAHALALRFNPRVRYGVYVLTARQDSDEFFRRMKERAIDKFLVRKGR